jgi:hypothetical protein
MLDRDVVARHDHPLDQQLRDVNYIHPSATITSPHRLPSLTIPRSNSLPG